MSKEQVLAFPSYLMDRFGQFQGLMKEEVLAYFDRITMSGSGLLQYIDREAAEKDPSFKQIIPYVILRRGNEVFAYQRTKKGGESRLYDKWSVGVGGHINPGDDLDLIQDTYDAAFARELAEEVDLALYGNREDVAPVVALIYDPSDSVGRVHFGVVHVVSLTFDHVLNFKDPALANGRWEHIIDLKARKVEFENWSQLVLQDLL